MSKPIVLTKICKVLLAMAFSSAIIIVNSYITYANGTAIDLQGIIYEFDKDGYDFSDSEISSSTAPYGALTVYGETESINDKDGIKSIAVVNDYDITGSGNLAITYSYDDKLLNVSEEEWHLIEDKKKNVDNIKLDEKINNGAIILQTSKDREIWYTAYTDTNIFEKDPVCNEPFYTTTDTQIINGCYYRIIVAYKTEKKTNPDSILSGKANKYYAEVYEFHAYDENARVITLNEDAAYTCNNGSLRTREDSYAEETAITIDDPHFGWNIGKFYIDGFTKDYKSDGNPVFLKNPGDQISLWFKLYQNINCLDGDSTKTIKYEKSGSDQYFGIKDVEFGHGILIVRKTNYENEQEEPIKYTNYLEAIASVDANTKVDLYEEGDYEVALDYTIEYKGKTLGLPDEAHYRIYFKFSVRNGSNMFYLIDTGTGSELSDNSLTPNGFRIDTTNSKYLKISYEKKVYRNGNLVPIEKEVSGDQAEFTDEGIYTITSEHEYLSPTTKTVCVGNNEMLKAHIVTGLKMNEIQKKLDQGAFIANDGIIIEPESEPEPKTELINEDESITEQETDIAEVSDNAEATEELNTEDNSMAKSYANDENTGNDEYIGIGGTDEDALEGQEANNTAIALAAVIAIIVIAAVVVYFIKCGKKKKTLIMKDDMGDKGETE